MKAGEYLQCAPTFVPCCSSSILASIVSVLRTDFKWLGTWVGSCQEGKQQGG